MTDSFRIKESVFNKFPVNPIANTMSETYPDWFPIECRRPECPDHPLDNIALAFSGGGFRAASFSLGVLSYLNRASLNGSSLLGRVRYLSSASGGTITAASYALCVRKGVSFQAFYSSLLRTLGGEQVLEQALKNINDVEIWEQVSHDKQRNLINAFSLVYDSGLLFGGATFNDLLTGEDSHLEEVCFNATEFFKGQSFRQQVKLRPDNLPDEKFVYGNEDLHLAAREVIGKIKLADALAASSCFPAGFEPIAFPYDFTHEGLDAGELKQALRIIPQSDMPEDIQFAREKTFALMDGGITDNQALNSMMYADDRRTKGETTFTRFDLMMVCDVGSHFMKSYEVPPVPKDGGGAQKSLSLRGLKIIVNLALLASLVTLVVCFTGVYPSSLLIVLSTVIATLCLTFWGIYVYIESQIFKRKSLLSSKKELNEDIPDNFSRGFSPEVLRLLTEYLDKTGFCTIKNMLTTRLNSVLTLNNDVFLKRVRKLIYDRFYSSLNWKYRRKANHIYDLSETNKPRMTKDFNDKWAKHLQPDQRARCFPTVQITQLAEQAFRMGTTLWFDPQQSAGNEMLRVLVATGQFTTCYNLIEYIFTLKSTACYARLDGTVREGIDELLRELLEDWIRFNQEDPMFLVREYDAAGQPVT